MSLADAQIAVIIIAIFGVAVGYCLGWTGRGISDALKEKKK